MGARRDAKKELAKEQELAKLRAKAQNKQAVAAARAAARSAKLAKMTAEERQAFLAREKKTRLVVAAVIVAVIVVLGIVGAANKKSSSTGNDSGGSPSSACIVSCLGDSGNVPANAFSAFDACKQFVSDRLKAPGSATWRDPIGNQVTYSGSGNTWTVDASVDSQNSFGASLRSTYTCAVTLSGSQWLLTSLNMS